MTATATSPSNTTTLLTSNLIKRDLVSYLHETKVSCGTLSREQVVISLGQWYHPLHYFPTFLSRLISVVPDLGTKTFISRILWQELGEGQPPRAHEKVYLETIHHNGFTEDQVTHAEPSPATSDLVDGYKTA